MGEGAPERFKSYPDHLQQKLELLNGAQIIEVQRGVRLLLVFQGLEPVLDGSGAVLPSSSSVLS